MWKLSQPKRYKNEKWYKIAFVWWTFECREGKVEFRKVAFPPPLNSLSLQDFPRQKLSYFQAFSLADDRSITMWTSFHFNFNYGLDFYKTQLRRGREKPRKKQRQKKTYKKIKFVKRRKKKTFRWWWEL